MKRRSSLKQFNLKFLVHPKAIGSVKVALLEPSVLFTLKTKNWGQLKVTFSSYRAERV